MNEVRRRVSQKRRFLKLTSFCSESITLGCNRTDIYSDSSIARIFRIIG